MKAAASKKPGRARKEASDAASPSPPPADVEVIPSSDDEGEDKAAVTIPPALLTRMLHQFFEKEGTRISKDANAAVAQYVDVFVREAIARAAAENRGGFLEVSSGVQTDVRRKRRGQPCVLAD